MAHKIDSTYQTILAAEDLRRRTQSAGSLLGKSALQKKLAQRSSVTSARSMEELIQPIILGIVRNSMLLEPSKQDSYQVRSQIGMRTSLKTRKMVSRKLLKPLRRILRRLLEKRKKRKHDSDSDSS